MRRALRLPEPIPHLAPRLPRLPLQERHRRRHRRLCRQLRRAVPRHAPHHDQDRRHQERARQLGALRRRHRPLDRLRRLPRPLPHRGQPPDALRHVLRHLLLPRRHVPLPRPRRRRVPPRRPHHRLHRRPLHVPLGPRPPRSRARRRRHHPHGRLRRQGNRKARRRQVRRRNGQRRGQVGKSRQQSLSAHNILDCPRSDKTMLVPLCCCSLSPHLRWCPPPLWRRPARRYDPAAAPSPRFVDLAPSSFLHLRLSLSCRRRRRACLPAARPPRKISPRLPRPAAPAAFQSKTHRRRPA
mmetsp:Transcript_11450/g.29088  ORF Transcript_11450/g.29088 Transcript_11450/m.29088 type:complete len:297 (+) Transcript_11450:1527-2417(+)